MARGRFSFPSTTAIIITGFSWMANPRSIRKPRALRAIIRAKRSRSSPSVERVRRVPVGGRALVFSTLRGKKTLEQLAAFRFTDARRDSAAMVQRGKLQQIQHAARRTRLAVAGAEHHTRQSHV